MPLELQEAHVVIGLLSGHRTWSGPREPRPTRAMAIIASQVSPKLMSETAAGS